MRYTIITLFIFLKISTAYAMPICNFFTQKEIISAYTEFTPETLKPIYFINISKNPYKTIIFNDDCKILYERNIYRAPGAVFSMDENSKIVFVVKTGGSANTLDAYLVDEHGVTPIITDLPSKDFPMFDRTKFQSAPDIITCSDLCNRYRFNNKKKRYINEGYLMCGNRPCLPPWGSTRGE